MKNTSYVRIINYEHSVRMENLAEDLDQGNFIIPNLEKLNIFWSLEKTMEFAKAVFLNYPINPIYVIRNKNNKLEIIDGKKRALAIYLIFKKLEILSFRYEELKDKKENSDKKTFLEKLKEMFVIDEFDYEGIVEEYENSAIYPEIKFIEICVDTSDQKLRDEVIANIKSYL